jgi:hypothetical protein
MRYSISFLLLTLISAAYADGFVYGTEFYRLRETDQGAVIRLKPGQATVDMYIGIDGIPKGKTITYVLPFWYAPDGFRMEEMTGHDFRWDYQVPAEQKLRAANTFIDAQMPGGHGLQNAIAALGSPLVGLPALLIGNPLADLREKVRQASHPQPYFTASTPNARADLYHIGGSDLQALLKDARLPTTYQQPLTKYHTSYFAVMHLTGTTAKGGSYGVHYHFTHILPKQGTGYRFIYPLGTGAAWPKPILLTEVLVTCPRDWQLDVESPREGIPALYEDIGEWMRWYAWAETPKDQGKMLDSLPSLEADWQYHAQHPDVSHYELSVQNTTPLPKIMPATATLMHPRLKHGFAWHQLYFMSNPSRDITIHMEPRPLPWRLRMHDTLNRPWVAYPLCLLFLLLGLALAYYRVFLPAGLRDGNDRSAIAKHFRRFLFTITFFMWGGSLLLYLLLGLFNITIGVELHVIDIVCGLVICAGSAVLGVYWYHRYHDRWLPIRAYLLTWITIFVVYAAGTGLLYAIFAWARQSMTG